MRASDPPPVMVETRRGSTNKVRAHVNFSRHTEVRNTRMMPRMQANLTDTMLGQRRCSVKGSSRRSRRTALCVTDRKCGRACKEYRIEVRNLRYSLEARDRL